MAKVLSIPDGLLGDCDFTKESNLDVGQVESLKVVAFNLLKALVEDHLVNLSSIKL